MNTLTVAQTRIVASVRKAATTSDRSLVKIADGLVALSDSGLAVRPIADLLTGTDYPLGRNRIALIVRTRRANADDAAYIAALRLATAVNSKVAEPVTADETDVSETVSEPVAQPVAKPVTVTLDALTDRLASLFADARTLTGDDFDRFVSSVTAEIAYSDAAVLGSAFPVSVAA